MFLSVGIESSERKGAAQTFRETVRVSGELGGGQRPQAEINNILWIGFYTEDAAHTHTQHTHTQHTHTQQRERAIIYFVCVCVCGVCGDVEMHTEKREIYVVCVCVGGAHTEVFGLTHNSFARGPIEYIMYIHRDSQRHTHRDAQHLTRSVCV